jgi:NADPH:quinone reductase-like Zn-dependent oxidoreductase
MRAIQLRQRFELNALELVQIPDPSPGPRDVLLRMRAASLNYRDLVVVQGRYGRFDLPLVPVSDGVGEVVAIGPEVRRFQVGDRVCPVYVPDWISGPPREELVQRRLGGPLPGVLSELVSVHEDAAVRAPAHLTDEEAATLPIAGVTAWHALFVDGRIGPGDTVVVQGTGGVSLFALQLARLAGARVIVTSRHAAKLERARALGATSLIDVRASPAWDERVRELTSGLGADHVIDVGGGEGLDRSIAACRTGGSVSLIGFLGGSKATIDLPAAFRRMVTLRAASVGSRASFEALARALEAGGVRPEVDAVFPWTEVRAAFERLAAAEHVGKIALRIQGAPAGAEVL